MLRSVALACGVFSVSLLVACSSDDEHHRHHGHGGVAQVAPACGAQTTCGTCTPVLGCGWCQYEDGRGRCATGPDACGTNPFRWNWDPDTCPVAPDAGSDAFTPADASPSETSDDAATEAASSETSSDDAGSDASGDAAVEAAAETSADAADEVAVETSVDVGTETAAETAAPTCKIPDLATSASCTPTTGGTLCKDGQYTLGCHGGTPDAALKCEKALTTPDGTYHCCSCGT